MPILVSPLILRDTSRPTLYVFQNPSRFYNAFLLGFKYGPLEQLHTHKEVLLSASTSSYLVINMAVKLEGGPMRGKIDGDAIAEENKVYNISGMITGNLEVRNNAVVILNGMVVNNLLVYDTSKVTVHGMVCKSIIVDGGDVVIYGMAIGDVVRKRGKVMIDKNAKVMGKVAI